MALSEADREKEFPVHIELGKKGTDMPMPVGGGMKPKGKKTPPMFYPVVYIEDIPGLVKLPKEGCMLVEFVRKRMSIGDKPDGDQSAGVTLELHTICLPDEQDESGPNDLEDAFKQAGKPNTDAEDAADENDADEYDEGE